MRCSSIGLIVLFFILSALIDCDYSSKNAKADTVFNSNMINEKNVAYLDDLPFDMIRKVCLNTVEVFNRLLPNPLSLTTQRRY